MDNKRSGRQNIQLSRLLFDQAADYFYFAIFLEIVTGITSLLFSILDLNDSVLIFGLIANSIFLVTSYALKIKSEDYYDSAETIRRQSVLSESLGWPISKLLISDWHQKAGLKLVKKLKITSLDPDYYSTTRDIGPARLAEMIVESAFYTRNLYIKLRNTFNLISILLFVIVVVIISIGLSSVIPDTVSILIAKVIYAIIPLYLSVNILGWSLRLSRIISEIRTIEGELDQLINNGNLESTNILRLVAEYNCQVVSGIPIHNIIFKIWHNEIEILWDDRRE